MYVETMLIPAIHYIINGFEISYNTSSWILTANLVTGAIMTPIIGNLSEILGKRILVALIVIHTLRSLSLGPSISGIYLRSFRSTIGDTYDLYPAQISYHLIFLTTLSFSILSVILTPFTEKKFGRGNTLMYFG